MSPHGAVIWLLAGATWVAVIPLAWLARRRRGDRIPETGVLCITDAGPPMDPIDPAELDEYASGQPAFDSAYAIEADGYAGDEQ